jgi:threonine/homoserine/homoserine lactone efflux protein
VENGIGTLTIVGQAILTIYAIFEAYRLRSRRPMAWRRRWLSASVVVGIALVLAWLDGDGGVAENARWGVFFLIGWIGVVALLYWAYKALNSRFQSESVSASARGESDGVPER